MAGEIFDQDTVSVRQGGALRKLSARWCCVLVAMLLAAPLLSAKAVGEGDAAPPSLNNGLLKAAASPFPSPRPVPSRPPAPLPARPSPPVPRATVTPAPPPPAPLPAVQPPAAASGLCADAGAQGQLRQLDPVLSRSGADFRPGNRGQLLLLERVRSEASLAIRTPTPKGREHCSRPFQ